MTQGGVDLLKELVLCSLLVTVDVGGDVFKLNHIKCFFFEKVGCKAQLHVSLLSVFNHAELFSFHEVFALLQNFVKRVRVKVGTLKDFVVNVRALQLLFLSQVASSSANQPFYGVAVILAVNFGFFNFATT
jgi:hypothetical protein